MRYSWCLFKADAIKEDKAAVEANGASGRMSEIQV